MRFQHGFHAGRVERCKARPQNQRQKYMQNSFPNSGSPLHVILDLRETAKEKIENRRLKGEFAGLRMGPSGGSVFGACNNKIIPIVCSMY